MMLTYERLREVLNYDPETGIFTWKVSTARCVRIGSAAGVINGSGYRVIRIDHHLHRAHRLAWFYMTGEWPPDEIDHVNGDKDDNRLTNLRTATSSQNKCNTRRHANSMSGFKGVSWTRGDRWRAQIRVDGKLKHLGYFGSAESAHAAYVSAAKRNFREFARFE